jgi:predicted TIM-barrel fold metal-dependent hydrolase
MTPEEFIQTARNNISTDPFSRLTDITKAMVQTGNCTYDIHCHIFDKKCLSIGYIALRFVTNALSDFLELESTDDVSNKLNLLKKPKEKLYDEIKKKGTDSTADWKKFENEIQAWAEFNDDSELETFSAGGLKQAWEVLKKGSMAEVFDYYHTQFAIKNIDDLKDRPFVTGILMMDLETGWGIKPERKYEQQITDLKALAKEKPILPFLAVDPRRENLYEQFLRAFTERDTSFFGVKCYPSLGYFASDKRLDPIFQICEEKNIPVTTHCGGEVVSTFEKTIEIASSTGLKKFKIPGENRAERAAFLNDPAHWDSVLNKYKKLRVNFAHFGGDTNWEKYSTGEENLRVLKIIEQVSNNTISAFTDFSFNIVEPNLFDKFLETLNMHPVVAQKTMFGTDFWVVLPSGDLVEMQKSFLEKMTAHKESLIHHNPHKFLFG